MSENTTRNKARRKARIARRKLEIPQPPERRKNRMSFRFKKRNGLLTKPSELLATRPGLLDETSTET